MQTCLSTLLIHCNALCKKSGKMALLRVIITDDYQDILYFHPSSVIKVQEEREPTSQLFSRLSVTLMRGNAMMLCSRCPDVISAEVDGAE